MHSAYLQEGTGRQGRGTCEHCYLGFLKPLTGGWGYFAKKKGPSAEFLMGEVHKGGHKKDVVPNSAGLRSRSFWAGWAEGWAVSLESIFAAK